MILVVCESPGKIAKIAGYLGKGHIVEASYGHFRDLHPNKLSVRIDQQYAPEYYINKKNVVQKLKSAMAKCNELYIASDIDKEGEAIGQHLLDVLKPKKYKRLSFSSITKKSILDSVKNATPINSNIVDSQKARRILDRLYGYLISPLLYNALKNEQINGISAGRVQSVALHIIIKRDIEIKTFYQDNTKPSHYHVNGIVGGYNVVLYHNDNPAKIDTVFYPRKLEQKIRLLMLLLSSSKYVLSDIIIKDSLQNPPPPFETSSLQKSAFTKLGMGCKTVMQVAQKLYEAGHITYMRTDSLHIDPAAQIDIKKTIKNKFGIEHYRKYEYHTKDASAQQAHEAIRPTKPELETLDLPQDQHALYTLIWQRTIASQMKPATMGNTKLVISIDNVHHSFTLVNNSQIIVYPGYLLVYGRETDDCN
jgi:DNA topoisomerase I